MIDWIVLQFRADPPLFCAVAFIGGGLMVTAGGRTARYALSRLFRMIFSVWFK